MIGRASHAPPVIHYYTNDGRSATRQSAHMLNWAKPVNYCARHETGVVFSISVNIFWPVRVMLQGRKRAD